MTTAPDDVRPLPTPSRRVDDDATVTALLPTRAHLLDRLAAALPGTEEHPLTLFIVGLRRRDDGWPIPDAALARITTLLANGLRGDDWLAASGPTEFAVLADGPLDGARAAADRMVAAVNAEGLRGMTAAAGVAALAPGLAASEVLRRATLCLATARTMGAGRVITYRGTR
jgi:GGDEF domain-containing protein